MARRPAVVNTLGFDCCSLKLFGYRIPCDRVLCRESGIQLDGSLSGAKRAAEFLGSRLQHIVDANRLLDSLIDHVDHRLAVGR